MSDPGLTSNDQVDDEPVDYDQEVQEFYDTHSGEVRGYLRNVGTPAEYIDDIVHDAFLAARRTWETLRTGNPRAYVFKVARVQRAQRAGNAFKLSQRTVVGLPIDPQRDQRLSAPDHADAIIDRLALESALATLPERQRQVIVLRKIADLSIVETAAILNTPEGTIKSDLNRGMAALQKLLGTAEERKEQ
jgi:RNA polymerase sigma factor (sigma-70 family)